jgi:hypothetical protein
MGVDPIEVATTVAAEAAELRDREASRLSSWVAITVALLATFLGVCKVKDDNIVQAMQQAQADKLDHWAFYQARNLREEVAESMATQLKLAAAGAGPGQQAAYQEALTRYEGLVVSQAQKKAEVKAQAEQDQKNYDALNYRDCAQFDLSDALSAIAISLLAVTALTHKRWLFWMAMVPTVLGAVMGCAGLFGWRLHSDLLAQLLS